MNNSDTTLEVRTLGRFGIYIDGKPVATEWPDETIKMFFCSLLSPLDLYISWDRVSRSCVQVAQANRHLLEEHFIRPLNNFLIGELGFNPLITGREGIRIKLKRLHLDAHDFYRTVVEGNKLLSRGNNAAALAKFNRAVSLYTGSYLPDSRGKIIENTRNDLESLYLTTVNDSIPHVLNAGYSGWGRRVESGMYLMAA